MREMNVAGRDDESSVFVYGSLMFDEVVECLTGKLFQTEPARLADHARYAVRQEGRVAKGPAITNEPGSEVAGRLLLDVDSDTLRILDRFECGDVDVSRYERVTVSVTLHSGKMMRAETYRAVAEFRPFLSGAWSEHDFKAQHLRYYVEEWIPRLRKEWTLA